MRLSYWTAFALSTLLANANIAEITEGMPYVEVEAEGETYKIERVQKEDSYLTNTFRYLIEGSETVRMWVL